MVKLVIMQLLSILIALLMTIRINAQTDNPPRYYEDKGLELLGKTSEKLSSCNSLIIDFTYLMENKSQNLYETSPGKLFMHGEKYNMYFDDYEYISDGTTVWIHLKDVGEIHVSYAENIDQSMNPVYLLKDFKEHYQAKFIRQELYEGKNINLVDAIPEKPQAFFKYRVAISENNNMPVYIIAYDRHGGNFKISFDIIEKNPEINPDKFSFDKTNYPDADLIDLR